MPSFRRMVMKPPPPILPADGIDDGQRIADGNRRIDGIAALLQHLDADFGGQVLGGDDHAVLAPTGAGEADRALLRDAAQTKIRATQTVRER